VEESAANSPKGFSQARSERKSRVAANGEAQHSEIQTRRLGLLGTLKVAKGRCGVGSELYRAWLCTFWQGNLEVFGIDSATGLSAESCSHTARGRRKATLTRGPQPSAKERREREGSGARGPPGAWWAAVGRRGARGWLATSGPRAWEKKSRPGEGSWASAWIPGTFSLSLLFSVFIFQNMFSKAILSKNKR